MGRLHKGFSKRTRRLVWESTGGTCWYCEIQLQCDADMSIDHKMPVCRGGTDDFDNLVPACLTCNGQKKDQTPEEFLSRRNCSAGIVFQVVDRRRRKGYRAYLDRMERMLYPEDAA